MEKLKVLFADDEPLMRDRMRELLEAHGDTLEIVPLRYWSATMSPIIATLVAGKTVLIVSVMLAIGDVKIIANHRHK